MYANVLGSPRRLQQESKHFADSTQTNAMLIALCNNIKYSHKEYDK